MPLEDLEDLTGIGALEELDKRKETESTAMNFGEFLAGKPFEKDSPLSPRLQELLQITRDPHISTIPCVIIKVETGDSECSSC